MFRNPGEGGMAPAFWSPGSLCPTLPSATSQPGLGARWRGWSVLDSKTHPRGVWTQEAWDPTSDEGRQTLTKLKDSGQEN